MFRKNINFTLNGQMMEVGGAEVFAPLSDTLRYKFRKTGTKVVCAEGDCGACTVLLARPIATAGSLVFKSINSCIFPTFSADGCHLVTVDGLATDNDLHEIQRAMVDHFGGQCGFCTPGFVMSIANMYEQKKNPDEKNVKNYLTGNLCRCTGYVPIIQAALAVNKKKLKSISELYPLTEEIKILQESTQRPVHILAGDREFFAPLNVEQASDYKNKNPQTRIFSGATDVGVQINKGKYSGNQRMSLHLVPELYKISVEANKIHLGARVTLDELQVVLQSRQPAFANFLNIFASPQIKNSATLVGNVANASPIADTIPYLMTVNSEVTLASQSGERTLRLTDFFKGYRSLALAPNEWISKISFETLDEKKHKIGLYKTSQRRDLDISAVNASFIFVCEEGRITEGRIGIGGVAATPLRLNKLEDLIQGLAVNQQLISKVHSFFDADLNPISDIRGTSQFRKSMLKELFSKYAREHLSL